MVDRMNDLPVAVKGDYHHAYYSSVHSKSHQDYTVDQSAQSSGSWARIAIHKPSSNSNCVSDYHHHAGDQLKGRMILKGGAKHIKNDWAIVDIRRSVSDDVSGESA